MAGRPTKYNAQFHPLLAEALARNGLTNPQMAEKMSISDSTLSNWMQEYPDFLGAIKRGREEPDDAVENSLYRMAMGYEHEVEKPLTVGDGPGESHVEIVKYTEKLAPNPTSMIFWLKNRRPAKWRDKQEIGLTDKDGNDRSFVVTFKKPEE